MNHLTARAGEDRIDWRDRGNAALKGKKCRSRTAPTATSSKYTSVSKGCLGRWWESQHESSQQSRARDWVMWIIPEIAQTETVLREILFCWLFKPLRHQNWEPVFVCHTNWMGLYLHWYYTYYTCRKRHWNLFQRISSLQINIAKYLH